LHVAKQKVKGWQNDVGRVKAPVLNWNIIIVFWGLGLLACSSSELIFWNLWIYMDSW